MKSFILGCGAQKSGTTWLYRYIAADPRVAVGVDKEYHVLDAIHEPECANFLISEAESLLSQRKAMQRRMQQGIQFYVDYFDSLLQQQGKSLTMDITPSYSCLKRDVFRDLAGRFQDKDIEVKAIFLMRDPVERCLSYARMQLQKSASVDRAVVEAWLRRYAFSRGSEIRTRYDLTLAELSASFTEASRHVALYEEMFDEEPLRLISGFCGVSFRPGLTESRFNAGRKTDEIGEDLRRDIVRHYSAVYETVGRLFPQARSLWSGFRYL